VDSTSLLARLMLAHEEGEAFELSHDPEFDPQSASVIMLMIECGCTLPEPIHERSYAARRARMEMR